MPALLTSRSTCTRSSSSTRFKSSTCDSLVRSTGWNSMRGRLLGANRSSQAGRSSARRSQTITSPPSSRRRSTIAVPSPPRAPVTSVAARSFVMDAVLERARPRCQSPSSARKAEHRLAVLLGADRVHVVLAGEPHHLGVPHGSGERLGIPRDRVAIAHREQRGQRHGGEIRRVELADRPAPACREGAAVRTASGRRSGGRTELLAGARSCRRTRARARRSRDRSAGRRSREIRCPCPRAPRPSRAAGRRSATSSATRAPME